MYRVWGVILLSEVIVSGNSMPWFMNPSDQVAERREKTEKKKKWMIIKNFLAYFMPMRTFRGL